MPETADPSLATFNLLAPQEQHELLQRSGELPDTVLSDDHLVGLADNVFQALDAEESYGGNSNVK